MKAGNHVVYAVVNEKNELVGLDEPSGGYPWIPSTWNHVHFWDAEDKAQNYCNIMNKGGSYGNFKPVTLMIRCE